MRKKVFSVLVSNTSGVLNRVAALFSRRGYNIDSLTVGVTENPEYSRMTIVAKGDDDVLEQIEKQISKLEDVIDITELGPDDSVCRELILVKVAVSVEQRQQVIAIADIFRAKIVDASQDSLMVELTGNQSKLDAFIELLEGYKIEQLVRTGITGLLRGKVN
ncbi:MAG: acetolactate synthase small subunit [Lachnospiraceae bacterium]|nr:acetolactate synthase small subunit [Lachnospiraceae bacterium]